MPSRLGALPKGKSILLGIFILAMANAVMGRPTRAADEPRRDRFGDPLPAGAVARLGSLRFRVDGFGMGQMQFTPDGKTLAAASAGGLWLLDAATGKRIRTIRAPQNWFDRISFSADGKRLLNYAANLALGSRKTPVEIWDVAKGRKTFAVQLDYVAWAGWSEKSEPLAACLGNDEIILHELATGRKQSFANKRLLDPPLVGSCRCAVVKNLLAASDADGAIHVWDLTTGAERFKLKPGLFVMSLAFTADGRRLAVVARDAANKNPVQIWDTDSGKLVRTLPPAYQVFFAPNGKTLAGTRGTEIRFWNADSGKEISCIRTVGFRFGKALAFSPDSLTFAANEHESGSIHLWDVERGEKRAGPDGHLYQPYSIAFSPDSRRVASGGGMDGTICIWEPQGGKRLNRVHRPGKWVRDIAYAADGRTLFSTWIDDQLWINDAATGERLHVLKMEDPKRPETYQMASRMQLSRDGRTLVAISYYYDKSNHRGPLEPMLLTGWDAATRRRLFRRSGMRIEQFALSVNAGVLAMPHVKGKERFTSGQILGEGPMRLEDLSTGETLLNFPKLPGMTRPIAFSPDGRFLLSDTWDRAAMNQPGKPSNVMRLWETASACEVRSLPLRPLHTAISRDGRLLALTARGDAIMIWDLVLDREWQRFEQPGARVNVLAFSPDNRHLVSGLSDCTLLVWDVEAPPELAGTLDTASLAKAWADLAGANAARAFRARWTLASSPEQATALLAKHLRPAQSADGQRLSRLLADLDSEQFAVREKAQAELVQLRELAKPALKKALANKPTLEMRRRVQAVLERLRDPEKRPETLRALRAVAVLEDIGTSAARRLLESLAAGAPEARLTRETKTALRRFALPEEKH